MIAGENDGFNFYYDPLFSLFFECRFHMSFININFGCDFGIDNYFGWGLLNYLIFRIIYIYIALDSNDYWSKIIIIIYLIYWDT